LDVCLNDTKVGKKRIRGNRTSYATVVVIVPGSVVDRRHKIPPTLAALKRKGLRENGGLLLKQPVMKKI
jgi:hypothetical protein